MSDFEYVNRLRDHYAKHQTFPSIAKLCEVVGLSSTSSVFALIGRLKEAGYLRSVDRRIAPGEKFFERQVLNSVRAGVPETAPAEDSPEGLQIDAYLVPRPSKTVLLRVQGDSMRDKGLLPGDLVVVERGAPAEPGQIVVAMVDGAPTVKILAKDRKGFYLKAANPDYEDIRPKDGLELWGLVTGSFRRFGKK